MNPCPPRLRRRLGHGGLSLLVLAGSSTLLWSAVTGTASAAPGDPVVPTPVCASGTCTVTYTVADGPQTFTVPTGVTLVTATVSGASGATDSSGGGIPGGRAAAQPGAGGRTTGTMTVASGDTLDLVVGGAGTSTDESFVNAPGGFGGGGDSGSYNTTIGTTVVTSGGGGSFLFDGDTLLLAAGGGGGSTSGSIGGAGGSATDAATAADSTGTSGGGGQPGTVTGNGAGGQTDGGDAEGEATAPDVLPLGGRGADGRSVELGEILPGAGGGGGFHAGGGGGSADPDAVGGAVPGGGGGGGAGFAAPSVTDLTGQAGVQQGDGQIVLSYADAPQVSFTSTAPSAVVGGTTYTVKATGSGTGTITYSVDAGTTNGACTVSGDVVTFLHAGTCAIAADQAADGTSPAAHAVQTFTVAPATQAITFALLDTTGHVGDEIDLVATGGGSSAPVVFTVGSGSTAGACTIDGTTLTLTGAGTCQVTANQAGDDDHAAAAPVTRNITVDRIATTVAVTFDDDTPVYGQPVTAKATVTGAKAGTVQFSVDGALVGDPVAIDADGTATVDLPTLEAAGHQVKATFTPTDEVTYAGNENELTLAVERAQTKTVLTVTSTAATAVVTAVGPGSGTPEGSVRFTIDGVDAGTVTLDHGKAALGQAIAAGRDVSAVYDGDTDFGGSSDSTARKDPVITAKVNGTSTGAKADWYSGPVTVTFSCTAGSAPLTDPGCPTPVTLSGEGASQNVTGTVTAQDGGIATVTVTGINIDLTKPTISAFFAEDGGRYFVGAVPPAGCIATDDLSGVYGCAGFVETKGKELTYQAFAEDQAGNEAQVTAHVTTYNRGIIDAPYADGAYTVRAGQTYTLVAKSTKRPQVLKPVAENKKPSSAGAKFTGTGDDTWSLGYTIPTSLKPGKTYNLGIKTTDKYSIKIRVIA